MILTPANQFDRVEASGCIPIGCRVAIDTAGVGEEIAIDTHGSLHRTRLIDLSHDVILATQAVSRSDGVEVITVHTWEWMTAVGLEGATVMTMDLAGVAMLGVGIALLVQDTLLVQITPGGIQMSSLAALLAACAGQDVLWRQLDNLLALALDGETIGCHRSGGQHPRASTPTLIRHLRYVAGPLLDGIKAAWQIVDGIGQTDHGLDTVRGLLGAQTQTQTLVVLVALPSRVLFC